MIDERTRQMIEAGESARAQMSAEAAARSRDRNYNLMSDLGVVAPTEVWGWLHEVIDAARSQGYAAGYSSGWSIGEDSAYRYPRGEGG